MIEVSVFAILFITFMISISVYHLLGVRKSKRYPKGPVGVPVLGHLPFFGRYPPTTFMQWKQKYGNVFSIKMGSWNTVVVNGYKAIKEAAEAPDDAFSSRPPFTTSKCIETIQGDVSLVFGPFDKTYLHHRKLTASALRMFTNRYSKLTEDLISEEAENLVENILNKSGGDPVDITSDIQYATGSVIYQILYGRVQGVKDEINLMVNNANEFTKFTKSGNPCDVLPWLQYVMPWKMSAFKEMMTRDSLRRKEKLEYHKNTFSPDSVTNLTDALLASNLQEKNRKDSGLTRSRLLKTTADLQGAGFDTSNKSLQWMILYMAMYPDVQKRVQREIDDVIGSRDRVELQDRPNLIFTEATILEVMRMSIIVPFALPKFTIKDTILDGYDIDKNTVVFFNFHSISYDEEFWGDPLIFRPDRLISADNTLAAEKCKRILPFGLGRRRCPGEYLAKTELFLLFTNLVRRCEFTKPSEDKYEFEPEPGLVYSPKHYRVLVKQRQ